MDTVFEHSAGGIVLTPDGRLVVVRTKNLKDDTVFALPKGQLEIGETAADAAQREVVEETGYLVERVGEPPQTASYWFVRDGTRVKKRVDFFRFDVVGGDSADHDSEIDEVSGTRYRGGCRAADVQSPGSRRREMARKAPGAW